MGISKLQLKQKAVALRRQGFSYREILEHVPVAKSTLSEWLHSIGLSKHQKQRLTEKKLASARRGAEMKRQKRVLLTNGIIEDARREIGKISHRELLLMGAMLYWAEGSKQKPHQPSAAVRFTNMDVRMIRFFLIWLKEVFKIGIEDLTFSLYIHETHRPRLKEIISFWSDALKISKDAFRKIYFKRSNLKTKRRNIGSTYYGVIQITVRCSTDLNRKIAGWIQGVVEYFR
jgi:hypothetical protein